MNTSKYVFLSVLFSVKCMSVSVNIRYIIIDYCMIFHFLVRLVGKIFEL